MRSTVGYATVRSAIFSIANNEQTLETENIPHVTAVSEPGSAIAFLNVGKNPQSSMNITRASEVYGSRTSAYMAKAMNAPIRQNVSRRVMFFVP